MENENAKIRWTEESIDNKGDQKVGDVEALEHQLESAAFQDQLILPQHLKQVRSATANPRKDEEHKTSIDSDKSRKNPYQGRELELVQELEKINRILISSEMERTALAKRFQE